MSLNPRTKKTGFLLIESLISFFLASTLVVLMVSGITYQISQLNEADRQLMIYQRIYETIQKDSIIPSLPKKFPFIEIEEQQIYYEGDRVIYAHS